MSVQVTVRYWAGARRAAGRDSEIVTASQLSDLLTQLNERPGLAAVLAASSILIDSVAARTDTPLTPGAVVDILPPFAGG
jgi:molybdopterin synthase sulfur carrier subunit